MPNFNPTLPSIDVNMQAVWSEQDRNQYEKYDFYLVKAEHEARKDWMTWVPLITDTVPWTPNMAEVMKQVIIEPAPILRQEFRPNRIQVDPLASIFNTRERTVEARLYWQDYFSPHFGFLPEFQDFMSHMIPARQTIEQQMRYDLDIFHRTYIWDMSPYVLFLGSTHADGELVVAPTGVDASGASNKTAAWMQQYLATMSNANAKMSFEGLFRAFDIFTEELQATPYEGSGQPGGDSRPLNEKYCFVTSSGQWNQFTNDPWLKENRPINMNIVTEAFRGDIFNRVRCKIEKYPQRYKLDANFLPTMAAPQTIDATDNRTIGTSDYTRGSVSQIEVGYLIGGLHYKRINVGAPPSMFAGPTGDPSKINGMDWNGRLGATRNFLIPRKDSAGAIWWDTNDMGRYMRFQGTQSMGAISTHAFNILPVVYRRNQGNLSTVVAT